MPCALRGSAMCCGLSRTARMPPWTRGCSVLTRPSSISGKPVTSAMSRTASPASASALRVPPVEISSTPKAGQAAGQVDQAGLVADAEKARRMMRMVHEGIIRGAAGPASDSRTLSRPAAAPLIVPMSASISAAAAAGQPPRTTQSCGESSVRCLSASSMGPGIRDSLGSRHSVLSSPLSSPARRSLPLRRRSTPSARRRSATWRLRRGSPRA